MTVRRQVVALACLLLLLGAWDFARRVHVGRDASLRAFDAPRLVPLPEQVGLPAIQADMARWFPGSDVAGPNGVVGNESLHLALLGVFTRRGSTIAVLEALSATGAHLETIGAVEGDVVHGLTVKKIEPHNVTLEGEAGILQLPLFEIDAPDATAGGRRVE
jgi:hypothetical protein